MTEPVINTIASTSDYERAALPFQNKTETNPIKIIEAVRSYFFYVINSLPESPQAWKACEGTIENIKQEILKPEYAALVKELYKKIVLELMYLEVPKGSAIFVKLLKDLLELIKPELNSLFNIYERCCLLDHINTCGDFYLQNILMQIIIYSGMDEMKQHLTVAIPDNCILRDEFERIRLEYIDQDIRKYLNAVNDCFKLVVSVLATEIYVNSKLITDIPIGGVWIDFSKATKVISFSLQNPMEIYVSFGKGDIKDCVLITETESYSLTLDLNANTYINATSLYELNTAKVVKFVFKGVKSSAVEQFLMDTFQFIQSDSPQEVIPPTSNAVIGNSNRQTLQTAAAYPTELFQSIDDEVDHFMRKSRTSRLSRRNESTQDRPLSRQHRTESSPVSEANTERVVVSEKSRSKLPTVMVPDNNLLEISHFGTVVHVSNSKVIEDTDDEIISCTPVEGSCNQNDKGNDGSNAQSQTSAEAVYGTQDMAYNTDEMKDIKSPTNENEIFEHSTEEQVLEDIENCSKTSAFNTDLPLHSTPHKPQDQIDSEDKLAQVTQIPHQPINENIEANPTTRKYENIINSGSRSKLNITVKQNTITEHQIENPPVQRKSESVFAVPATPPSVLRKSERKTVTKSVASTSVNSSSESVSEISSVNKKRKVATRSIRNKKNKKMTDEQRALQKYYDACSSSNMQSASVSNTENNDINIGEEVEMRDETEVERSCRYIDRSIKHLKMYIKCCERAKYYLLKKD